jgi:hypothetical protein
MMPSSTTVARVRRVSERLDEMNFRLRILRDPFQAMTIAGQRLVEKEKARNSAAEPVARERPRGYLDTRHTVTWLIGVRTVGERW